MRTASRKKESVFQQRRGQWLKNRASAQTLRSAHPTVELIRVELNFRDTTPRTPTPQIFIVHPPARAFFEYPCPYADCDGKFDLGAAATRAMASAAVLAEGTLVCEGVRSRNGLQRQPCGLCASFVLTTKYVVAPSTRK
jgi:hypothetical protein